MSDPIEDTTAIEPQTTPVAEPPDDGAAAAVEPPAVQSSAEVTDFTQVNTDGPEVNDVEADQMAPAGPAVVVRAASSVNPEDFGRVDESGQVWVKDGDGERLVGSYPDVVPDNPLEMYTRRYVDLEATINLFEMRLPQLTGRDIDQGVATLVEAVREPAAVGDLAALRQRVEELSERARQRRSEAKAERAQAKAQALAERTAVVEAVEALAAQDPSRTQWKSSAQKLRDLLDEWKRLQRSGPRLDRGDEDALWKRFSSARTTFDRHRRQFYSQRESRQAEAKRIKERLVSQAEEIQHSTDWGHTAGVYRDLMDQWKKAGQAARRDEDALWVRFRAAQQVFFDARRENSAAIDAQYRDNLQVKEALLDEAEALLPVEDVEAAVRALREIQDRWDEAGRVPRQDVSRIEGRMHAVEKAVREAEQEQWRRSDPTTKARAEGMLGQLEASIAGLEADLEVARLTGDERQVEALSQALATKRAWREQIQGAVES